jgi:hypothetical protein
MFNKKELWRFMYHKGVLNRCNRQFIITFAQFTRSPRSTDLPACHFDYLFTGVPFLVFVIIWSSVQFYRRSIALVFVIIKADFVQEFTRSPRSADLPACHFDYLFTGVPFVFVIIWSSVQFYRRSIALVFVIIKADFVQDFVKDVLGLRRYVSSFTSVPWSSSS